MKIKTVTCKTALSKSSLPGLDYSLNPYRGCQHSCIYCYVPNILKISREKWGDFVNVKSNIPTVLSKELKHKEVGVVGISTVTDPYQPVEQKHFLTRYCLEQILKYDFPVCIQTKSSLIIRDIDLISKFSNSEVMVSIATLNDEERKLLEPYASSIEDRLKILEEFSNVGVKTTVFLGPLYPTIQVKDVSHMVEMFKEYGASEIMIDKLNLKPGIWSNIEKTLKDHPEIYHTFSENILKNKKYYFQIRKQFIKIGGEKHMKIVDAF